jgi:hypothetical protein
MESQNTCFCLLSRKLLLRPPKREKTKSKNSTSSWSNKLNWTESNQRRQSWPTWTRSTLLLLPIHLGLPLKTRSNQPDHSRLQKPWLRSKGLTVRE